MPNGPVWVFGLPLADFAEIAERHKEGTRVGSYDAPTVIPDTPWMTVDEYQAETTRMSSHERIPPVPQSRNWISGKALLDLIAALPQPDQGVIVFPQAEGYYIVQLNSDPASPFGLLAVEPESPMFADLRIRHEASHQPVVHDAPAPPEALGTLLGRFWRGIIRR